MNFSPEWHALGREAELAAEMIASGVTSLGKARFDQDGLYSMAFNYPSGLSVQPRLYT